VPAIRRDALVAGAAGRLGEALLAEVVGSGRYRKVTVLTSAPLGSTVASLQGITLEALQQAGEPVAQDELDVFVCWSDAADPYGSAYNRRDAVYAQIQTPDQLRAVAVAAAARRARRLLLVAPLLAWQQVSAAGRMLPEAMEMELARLSIPVIVIMRPTTEQQSRAVAGSTRLQRFARFYLSQLRFMLPAVTQTLRSNEIARAALSVVAEADTPGLTVVPLEDIREHAGQPRAQHAGGWRRGGGR
jgi:hypothetical protein